MYHSHGFRRLFWSLLPSRRAYDKRGPAGKDAVFECKIKAVKAPKAAEINDELATKFGAEDLAALEKDYEEVGGSGGADDAAENFDEEY